MTENPYQSPAPEQQPVPARELLAQSAMSAQAAPLLRRIKNGASWFYWLAALSIINSVLATFKGGVHFIFGLTITQVFDEVGQQLQAQGIEHAVAVVLVLDVLAAGVFVLFGTLALRGMHAMFIISLALYALDALLALFLGLYLELLFHAFVGFQILSGWRAHRELDALADEAVAPEAI